MSRTTELAKAPSWLLLAAGDDLARGNNEGYRDEPTSSYEWDSTVPRHADLSPGDLIALWDKHRLLGVSVIDEISEAERTKKLFRCPECGAANFKARKQKVPTFRCYECRAEFEKADGVSKSVTAYWTSHEAGWVDLPGRLTGSELRSLCQQPKSQQSIRPLDTRALLDALKSKGVTDWLALLATRRPMTINGEGHADAVVRVRRGQASFRAMLLAKYANTCAVLGSQPEETLEACHLYSYAEVGKHAEHGGLLLRRDIHQLFDMGRVAINPDTLKLDVDPTLGQFSDYARLHGSSLAITPSSQQRKWLGQHWRQHRDDPADSFVDEPPEGRLDRIDD